MQGASSEVEKYGPTYSVYEYSSEVYKVVHFKAPRPLVLDVDRTKKGNTEKLGPALSRAKKMVLEYALCNKWDYFCTFTIDAKKYDRHDLAKWYKDFSQFIRNERRRTGFNIAYVIIPELHKDGAWHAHALFRGLVELVSFRSMAESGAPVPQKLLNGDYWNWPEYQRRFGFCSFGPIKSRIGSAFYITKYLTKDVAGHSMDVGAHLYYASQKLERATLRGSISGENGFLNKLCDHECEWVDTGWLIYDGEFSDYGVLDWIDAFIEASNYKSPVLVNKTPPAEVCPEWYFMEEVVQECISGV